ncbi:MAG: DUF1365 domain-containing protein [Parvularculaceae bacterium]
MTGAPARLYHGVVTHRRLKPVGHRFAYRVFSMLIDIDRIDDAANRLRWFSRNAFNLFSMRDADHAFADDATISESVRAVLRENGYSGAGRIELLCYPRILGYVFNPLSIYYCRDAGGEMEAVLYEVRNTFGGRHSYLMPVEPGAGVIRQNAAKALYVSPFMDMDHRYAFRLSKPADTLSVFIHQTDPEGPIFNASFAGRSEDMSDAALIRAFFRYPLMTVKIIAAIHFEAVRLLMKGLRYRRRVADPAHAVSAAPLAPRLRQELRTGAR